MQNQSERRTDGEKLLKQLKEQWGHQTRYCEPTAIPARLYQAANPQRTLTRTNL